MKCILAIQPAQSIVAVIEISTCVNASDSPDMDEVSTILCMYYSSMGDLSQSLTRYI